MGNGTEQLPQAWKETHHPTQEHEEQGIPGKGEPMQGKARKRESKWGWQDIELQRQLQITVLVKATI